MSNPAPLLLSTPHALLTHSAPGYILSFLTIKRHLSAQPLVFYFAQPKFNLLFLATPFHLNPQPLMFPYRSPPQPSTSRFLLPNIILVLNFRFSHSNPYIPTPTGVGFSCVPTQHLLLVKMSDPPVNTTTT